MNKLFIAVSLLGVAAVSPAFVFQSGFENLEDGTSTFTGSFATVGPSSNTLGGKWSVDSGSVDWINTYWTAAQGSHSVDLNGNNAGTISTSFPTVTNTTYRVTFKMAGNPDNAPDSKSIEASVVPAFSGSPQIFNFSTISGVTTTTNMGWVTKSFSFVSSALTTTLSFKSLNQSAFGAALDDVQVEAVPEPFTLALGAAGLVSALRRRRAR